MPTLEYGFLCAYVCSDPSAVAHMIAAGVDTIYTEQVPTERNLGLLTWVTFTQGECGPKGHVMRRRRSGSFTVYTAHGRGRTEVSPGRIPPRAGLPT